MNLYKVTKKETYPYQITEEYVIADTLEEADDLTGYKGYNFEIIVRNIKIQLEMVKVKNEN